MSVDPKISLSIVKNELKVCHKDIERFGWEISEIDEINQTFKVKMKSPIDDQQYIMEIKFDNYKEWPLLIEFIDPVTGERGTKNAHPTGPLFHDKPCICNPCSRKAYKGYTDLHQEWNLIGWQNEKQVGTLINIQAILRAISSSIRNHETYRGRKSG